MAIIKTDTFTEASDTALESHTSDSGGGWSGFNTTSFDVVGADDEVKVDALSDLYAAGTETPSSADYWCNVNCRTVATTIRRIGSCVRVSTGTTDVNCYALVVTGSDGSWRLRKILSAAITQIAGGTISGFNAATWYDLKVQAQGTTIKGFIDGSEVASVTDSDISAVGKVGIFGRGTEPRITSLTSEDFAGGGDPEGSLTDGKLIRGGLLRHGVLIGG